MKMGAIQLALRTATKSNNSDLIMMAALALYDKCARREGVRRRDAPEVPSSLLDLMSHFPLVFNSWLFYLEQTDPNRLLQVMNAMGKCDEVVHLLLRDAYNELELPKRKAALQNVQRVIATAVSAGRKDMQFYADVGVSEARET